MFPISPSGLRYWLFERGRYHGYSKQRFITYLNLAEGLGPTAVTIKIRLG